MTRFSTAKQLIAGPRRRNNELYIREPFTHRVDRFVNAIIGYNNNLKIAI
jgi:hypothetical protein